MTKAFPRLAFTALFAMLCGAVQAQQAVEVAYQYEGNANLSSIRPSLRIAEFSDSRNVDNKAQISADYVAEAALADIVRDAFVQAFTSGGAELVDSGEDMVIAGEITDATLQTVDRGGVQSLQLTIRTSIALEGRGRTIFDTNLFGRGTVPVEEGIVAAVHASLDRMVSELLRDDYFMIELQ